MKIALILSLLVVALSQSAKDMSLQDFLVWLSSSGGAAIFMSFLAERIPAVQKWTPDQRNFLHLGGSLVLALGSFAVLTYVPEAILKQLAPFFMIVYGVVGTWVMNQIAHSHDPLAKRGGG